MKRAIAYLSISLTFLLFGVPLPAQNMRPSEIEIRREEYLIRQRLNPELEKALKDQYLGMVVNINYVLQHDPIVSDKAKVTRLELPGFGTRVTITHNPNDIAGYIDKYIRYRTITVITGKRLPESVEESLAKMMKESEELDLSGKDKLDFFFVAEEKIDVLEKPKEFTKKAEEVEKGKTGKNQIDQLVKNLEKDRKEKEERVKKLFPEFEQPLPVVDPRQEAESSKHLISSRKAYYNNDLNTALNELIEAININPYSAKSYEMLGSIYYRLKWYSLALNNWEKALALDPENRKLNKYILKAKSEL